LIGALLVDKPAGPTSHDIVAFTRRLLKTPRVGHTGTLDPLATGLLVLLIGPATRLAQFLLTDEKEYLADVRLGVATPTYDAQSLGEREPSRATETNAMAALPSIAEVERALDRFRGTFLQTPPPFSAKKVDGVRAYAKARKNQAVDLAPVEVTVREIEVLGPGAQGPPASDLVRLRVVASAGFYVRSLAHDLGRTLGCGAHLDALRRTRAGRFRIEEAATLDELERAGTEAAERLIPVNALLAHLPAVALTDEGLRRATNGNPLGPGHLKEMRPGPDPFFRILDGSGQTLAVAERRDDGLLHPVTVLR
jgi:tRNA pseudouridine55 synthase